MLLRHFTTQFECAALYFTGSHQYRQTRTAHWTVYAVETQKKRYYSGWNPTADWRSQKDASKEWNDLWEPAGDFQWPVCFKHVKQQLCISLPGKDGNYLPFSCIFKASSLHKFTSSSGKSNKSLTTRQDLEHGISRTKVKPLLSQNIHAYRLTHYY